MSDFNPNTLALLDKPSSIQDISTNIRNSYTSESESNSKDLLQSIDELNSMIGKDSNFAYSKPLTKTENKPSFTSPYYEDESLYVKLNSGEYINRYDTFTPFINNEEKHARQQSGWEQLTNGIEKLGGKTLTAVAGGTVGVVSSLINGIKEGSLSAAFNDDLNNWLDDLNTKMDYKLPNYYTEEAKNKSFFEQLGTVNFWADKVGGGLSFTLGAIGSEMIWGALTGGVGLLASEGQLARMSRWASGRLVPKAVKTATSEYKLLATQPIINATKASKVLNAGVKGTNLVKALDTTRFLITSSGYEAGVEARQYMKQTEADWGQNFEATNGRTPNETELTEFRDKLTSAGNVVFAANLGIVGLENMLTIGKLVRGKTISPTVNNSWINRNLFGVGFKEGEKGALEAIKATTKQKVTGRVYGLLKVGASEGLWEEGMQGVASKSASDYVLSAYDENKIKKGYDVIDSVIHGFKESYGTKEGLEEVGIGVIVGLLGGGVTSVASGEGLFNEKGVERKQVEQKVDYYNKFHADSLVEAQKANARIAVASEKSDIAKARGDLFGELRADSDIMLASIDRAHGLLDLDRTKEKYKVALESVNDEDLAKEFGIPTEEVKSWKQAKLDQYNQLADSFEKGTQIAQAYLGDFEVKEIKDKENLARQIAYTYASGVHSQQTEKDITETISKLIGEEFGQQKFDSTIKADVLLDKVGKEKTVEYERLLKSEKALKRREKLLVEQTLSKTPTRKQNINKANKAEQARRELIEVEDQLRQITEQKKVLADTINLNNNSNIVLTVDVLDSQKQNLEQLSKALDSLKETNPHKYQLLQQLITAQSKAIESTKSFDKMFRELNDPNNRVTVVRGFLDKMLKARKGKDEYTYFSDLAKNYYEGTSEEFINEVKQKTEEAKPKDKVTLEDISEEEYKSFVDKGEVTNERLLNIAEKLKNNIKLTKKEEAIFTDKTSEINDILSKTKEEVEKPNIDSIIEELKTTNSINKRKELLQKLENLNIIQLKC